MARPRVDSVLLDFTLPDLKELPLRAPQAAAAISDFFNEFEGTQKISRQVEESMTNLVVKHIRGSSRKGWDTSPVRALATDSQAAGPQCASPVAHPAAALIRTSAFDTAGHVTQRATASDVQWAVGQLRWFANFRRAGESETGAFSSPRDTARTQLPTHRGSLEPRLPPSAAPLTVRQDSFFAVPPDTALQSQPATLPSTHQEPNALPSQPPARSSLPFHPNQQSIQAHRRASFSAEIADTIADVTEAHTEAVSVLKHLYGTLATENNTRKTGVWVGSNYSGTKARTRRMYNPGKQAFATLGALSKRFGIALDDTESRVVKDMQTMTSRGSARPETPADYVRKAKLQQPNTAGPVVKYKPNSFPHIVTTIAPHALHMDIRPPENPAFVEEIRDKASSVVGFWTAVAKRRGSDELDPDTVSKVAAAAVCQQSTMSNGSDKEKVSNRRSQSAAPAKRQQSATTSTYQATKSIGSSPTRTSAAVHRTPSSKTHESAAMLPQRPNTAAPVHKRVNRRLSVTETIQQLSDAATALTQLKESLSLVGKPRYVRPTRTLQTAESATSFTTVELVSDQRILHALTSGGTTTATNSSQRKMLPNHQRSTSPQRRDSSHRNSGCQDITTATSTRDSAETLCTDDARDIDFQRKLNAARYKGFKKLWQLPHADVLHLQVAGKRPLKEDKDGNIQASANATTRMQYRLYQLHNDELVRCALMDRVEHHKRSGFGSEMSRSPRPVTAGNTTTFHTTQTSRELAMHRKEELEDSFRESAALASAKHDTLAAVRAFRQHQANWLTVIHLVNAFSLLSGVTRDSRVARVNIAAVCTIQRLWKKFQQIKQRRYVEACKARIHRWLLSRRYHFQLLIKQRAAKQVLQCLVDVSSKVSGFTIKLAGQRLLRKVTTIQRAVKRFLHVQRKRMQLLTLWWYATERLQHELAIDRGRTPAKLSQLTTAMSSTAGVNKAFAMRSRRNSVSTIPSQSTEATKGTAHRRRNSMPELTIPVTASSPKSPSPFRSTTPRLAPNSARLGGGFESSSMGPQPDPAITAVWTGMRVYAPNETSTLFMTAEERSVSPYPQRQTASSSASSTTSRPAISRLRLASKGRPGSAAASTQTPSMQVLTRLLINASLNETVLLSPAMAGLPQRNDSTKPTTGSTALPPGCTAILTAIQKAKALLEVDVHTRQKVLQRYLTSRLRSAAARAKEIRSIRAQALRDQRAYYMEKLETARRKSFFIGGSGGNNSKQNVLLAAGAKAVTTSKRVPTLAGLHARLRSNDLDYTFISATEENIIKLLDLSSVTHADGGLLSTAASKTTTTTAAAASKRNAKAFIAAYDCSKRYPPFRLITGATPLTMLQLMGIARFVCNADKNIFDAAAQELQKYLPIATERFLKPMPPPQSQQRTTMLHSARQRSATTPGSPAPTPSPSTIPVTSLPSTRLTVAGDGSVRIVPAPPDKRVSPRAPARAPS